MRFTKFVVAASLLIAAPAAAQEKGTFEIGGFGRYTGYPSDNYKVRGPDDNRVGFGGRLGYFLSDKIALELDGSYNPTDLVGNQPTIPSTIGARSRPLAHNLFHLQAVYNQPLGSAVSWMIGAGPGYHKLTKGIEESYVGIGAMTGLRLKPASWLNLRVEGTYDVVPSGFGDESNRYLGAQAGLSFLLGGGCDHSTDMIGIRPTSATLEPGQSQTFMAEATYCGKPDAVVYRLSGPGTLDSLTGRYVASETGTAQVMAYSQKGKLMSTANVTVRAPAPPPPPPVAPRPAPTPAPEMPKYTFEMQMVHFRFDRSDLTQGAKDTLNAVATTLKSNAGVNVDVIGHTDWVGTNAYNMKLSQARAETVRKYLIEQGVAADRIAVKWRGEEEPAADNKTAAGRATNRRAEIKQNN